jgi:hypothetical protein
MALNRLKQLKSSRSTIPPAVIIHAVKGKGKSSLAAEFPNPIYLAARGEATPDDIELPSLGSVETWRDVTDSIDELAGEDHDFQTLIIDTVDGLEPLVWAETCARNKWDSIESPGYGKGYLAADATWLELIDGLDYLRRERGMMIVLIMHSEISNHEEPGAQPYKRYDMKLHKRAEQMLGNWAQHIFFINTKVEIKETDGGFNKKNTHAEGGGVRWIYTDARPAFVAKNRAANMPPQIHYKRGEGFKALAPYILSAAPKVIEHSESQAAE